MSKHVKWKSVLISIFIALGVGALSGIISMKGMLEYKNLKQPSFAPPDMILPFVWTILFILMGISSYLVYKSDANPELKAKALKSYIFQLAVNFFWPIIFYCFKAFLFGFIWIVFLWFLILIMIKWFYKINKRAAWLQVPYFAWTTFAGILNLAIYFLDG